MQKFQYRDGSNLTQKIDAETDWIAKQGWTNLTTIIAQTAEMRPNSQRRTGTEIKRTREEAADLRHTVKVADLRHTVKVADLRYIVEVADLRYIVKVADLRYIVEVADLRYIVKVTDLRYIVKVTDLSYIVKVADLRHRIKVIETSLSAPSFQLHCAKFPLPCNKSHKISQGRPPNTRRSSPILL